MPSHKSALFILSGVLIAVALFPAGESPAGEKKKQFASTDEMSGYHLSDYAGFEKNWQLVTVRYRKDTGEQRFTYANPIAWKALQEKVTDYPDGAVFGKIAFATADDLAFPSSAVPTATRRYQLMVRDRKNHAETGGWGYALFDSQGMTFPVEPKPAVTACFACHNIVRDRGYIFSVPLNFTPGAHGASASAAEASRVEFETVAIDHLPKAVRSLLPENTKEVRVVVGQIAKNFFQGTLDEIRPALAFEALEKARPALLMNEAGNEYSLVFEDHSTNLCRKEKESQRDMIGFFSQASDKAATPRQLSFCSSAHPNVPAMDPMGAVQ